MELSQAWVWYCLDRLGTNELPPPEELGPWQVLELLFDFVPLFHARHQAIAATRYDDAFDEEADGALALVAMSDTFSGWDELTAGAWRVLAERWTYAGTVAAANAAMNNPVIGHLPIGLDRQSRARAVLLQFLLGGARTIDRRLLRPMPDGSLPEFPAATRLRRQ